MDFDWSTSGLTNPLTCKLADGQKELSCLTVTGVVWHSSHSLLSPSVPPHQTLVRSSTVAGVEHCIGLVC